MNQSSTVPSVNGCDMLCEGSALEYCGGASRLNLYVLNGTAPIPTTTGMSSTS